AQIVFGWGRRTDLPQLASQWGQRIFLVSGSRTLEQQGVVTSLEDSLRHAGLTVHRFSSPSHEPEVQDVDKLALAWRELHPTSGDAVVAIGGGSTLDLAKAASALVTQETLSSVVDFLEGVGRGFK